MNQSYPASIEGLSGPRDFSGATPVGNLTPSFVGQMWLNDTDGIPWFATGLTNADWVKAFVDPLTTRGDILYRDASNTSTRLAISTTNRHTLISDGVDLLYGYSNRIQSIDANNSVDVEKSGGIIDQVTFNLGSDTAVGTYNTSIPFSAAPSGIVMESADASGGNTVGGNFTARAGDGDGTAAGGSVDFTAGNAPGAGSGGSVSFTSGDSATGNAGNIVLSIGSDTVGTGDTSGVVLANDHAAGRLGSRLFLRENAVSGNDALSIVAPETVTPYGLVLPTSGGTAGQILTVASVVGTDVVLQFSAAGGTGGTSQIAADITARDALTVGTADIVYVTDASGDADIESGPAVYIWDGTAYQRFPNDEVVLSVTALAGAAPDGAKFGIDTVSNVLYAVVGGTWQALTLGGSNNYVVADIAARDALTPNTGDFAYVADAVADAVIGANIPATYVWDGAAWQLQSDRNFAQVDLTATDNRTHTIGAFNQVQNYTTGSFVLNLSDTNTAIFAASENTISTNATSAAGTGDLTVSGNGVVITGDDGVTQVQSTHYDQYLLSTLDGSGTYDANNAFEVLPGSATGVIFRGSNAAATSGADGQSIAFVSGDGEGTGDGGDIFFQPGDGTVDGALQLRNTTAGDVAEFQHFSDAINYFASRPAAGMGASYTIEWPGTIGTAGQNLQITGVAGTVASLGWVTSAGSTNNVVADITARDALVPNTGDTAYVQDATGDIGVALPATYIYDGAVWQRQGDQNFAHSSLTALANQTHTLNTFSQAHNYTTGTETRTFNDGTNDSAVTLSSTAVRLQTNLPGSNITNYIDVSPGVIDIQALNTATGNSVRTQHGNNFSVTVADGAGNYNASTPFIATPAAGTVNITSASAAAATNLDGGMLQLNSGAGDGTGNGGIIQLNPGTGTERGSVDISFNGAIAPLRHYSTAANYVEFQASPAMGASYEIIWPNAVAAANEVLTVTGVTGTTITTDWVAPAAGGATSSVVADITARDALTPATGDLAYVQDASGDAAISSAIPAHYVWDGAAFQRLGDRNLLESDLTADAARTHDFAEFTQTWNNMSTFTKNFAVGLFPTNSAQVIEGLVQMLSEVTSATRTNRMELDLVRAAIEQEAGGNTASFSVQFGGVGAALGVPQTHVVTQAVDAGTATVGHYLQLTDAATGEVEFAAAAGGSTSSVVADITARDALTPNTGDIAYVQDATGDVGVAIPRSYVWDGAAWATQSDLNFAHDSLTALANQAHTLSTFNQINNYTTGSFANIHTNGANVGTFATASGVISTNVTDGTNTGDISVASGTVDITSGDGATQVQGSYGTSFTIMGSDGTGAYDAVNAIVHSPSAANGLTLRGANAFATSGNSGQTIQVIAGDGDGAGNGGSIQLQPGDGTADGSVQVLRTPAGDISLFEQFSTAAFSFGQRPAAAMAASYDIIWPGAIGTANQNLRIASVAGTTATLEWANATAGSTNTVVADITARDAQTPTAGDITYVQDASGDANILSALPASYVWDGAAYQRVGDRNVAESNLTADAAHTHTYAGFNQTNNYTTGEYVRLHDDGTVSTTMTTNSTSHTVEIINTSGSSSRIRATGAAVSARGSNAAGVQNNLTISNSLILTGTDGTGAYDSAQAIIYSPNLVGGLRFNGADATAATNNNGQNIQLTAGNGDGTGDGGNITLEAGTGTAQGQIRIDFNGGITPLRHYGTAGDYVEFAPQTGMTGSYEVLWPLTPGAANEVLTITGVAGTTLTTDWVASAAGFTDPMTTRGDIIYRDATNTTARLGIGATAYQTLIHDGTDTLWGYSDIIQDADTDTSVVVTDGVFGDNITMTLGPGAIAGTYGSTSILTATNAGGIIMNAPNGTGGNTAGSGVTINGGNADGTGNAGEVTIASGDSPGSGQAGDVNIVTGNATGTGAAGSIRLTVGSTTTGTPGEVVLENNNLATENGSRLAFRENAVSGNDTVTMVGPETVATSYEMILPDTVGAVNEVLGISAVAGQVLTLDWQAAGGTDTNLLNDDLTNTGGVARTHTHTTGDQIHNFTTGQEIKTLTDAGSTTVATLTSTNARQEVTNGTLNGYVDVNAGVIDIFYTNGTTGTTRSFHGANYSVSGIDLNGNYANNTAITFSPSGGTMVLRSSDGGAGTNFPGGTLQLLAGAGDGTGNGADIQLQPGAGAANGSVTIPTDVGGNIFSFEQYSTAANYIGFQPAAGMAASYDVIWPATQGAVGQNLQVVGVAGTVITLGWV